MSRLEYVDMGFDSLTKATVQSIANQTQHMTEKYQPINLPPKNKKGDLVPINQVYQEQYPFWSPPYQVGRTKLTSYTLGNRVLNINSTNKEYIPFGLRGTVVGHTEQKVIVQFDEQFLHGTTMYGHCRPYQGALVKPSDLFNLSQQFAKLATESFDHVSAFQEKPMPG